VSRNAQANEQAGRPESRRARIHTGWLSLLACWPAFPLALACLCAAPAASGQAGSNDATATAASARVVIVHDAEATEAFTPRLKEVRRMVQRGLTRLTGKTALAEASYGRGKIVLFAFRPQHRGQSWGTFPFIFNSLER